MDEKQVAFIICVNDEDEFQESLGYIESLTVPEGFRIDIIAVREASSMAAGYNAAMRDSDAKYKIYMHQDVFLIYRNLLKDIIAIFQKDAGIGMIGAIGCRVLPRNGHAISRWDTGRVLCNGNPNYYHGYQDETSHRVLDVMAIDGMFMATQYDIVWREDLFDGWDFYDISQSCEFIRRGKRVVVPYQREYWAFHDNKSSNLRLFDAYRFRFIEEYQDIYPFQAEEDNGFGQRDEYEQVKIKAKRELEMLIDAGKIDKVCGFMQQPENQGHMVLKELELICRIYASEKEIRSNAVMYDEQMSYQEVYGRFRHLRHLIKRVEFRHGGFEGTCTELINHYSAYAVVVVILTYGMWKKQLYDKLLSAYQQWDERQYQEFQAYQKIFTNIKDGQVKNAEPVEKKRLMIVGQEQGQGFSSGVADLVARLQDRLYSDYKEVLVYGEGMEEYVKLFHNTNIPLLWYMRDQYTCSFDYSSNVQRFPIPELQINYW